MQKRVVCVRQGTRYGQEYLTVMDKCLKKHGEYSLFCLSDGDNPVETIKLRCGYDGWWAKMELFAPWNANLRPFLFLDLDVLVLDNIDDIFDKCGHDFWMLRDFNRPNGGQSSQMWVTDGMADEIWKLWSSKHHSKWISQYIGDQDFIEMFPFRRFQDEFSGMMSYKKDKLQDSSRDARIVHFHGKPKMIDTLGWPREIWDGNL